jgi:protocatechuate 3,4-dioxygenase beta subunit
MRRLVLFSLLLTTTFGLGETPPAQVGPGSGNPPYSGQAAAITQPPSEKFTLSGTVVDSATGEGISRALVQIYALQRRTTFSDDNGRFQFEGVPRGSYAVTAQRPGYFSEQELSHSGVHPADAGPDSTPVIVKLTPEAIISGKVSSTTGMPLEHVPLSLSYIDIREGRRHWETKGSVVTDEDGQYRLASLRPGTYYLSAGPYTPVAESILEDDERATRGYQELYYPSATDLASASPIQLRGGQQTEADFALTEVPVYAVSGTISGYGSNQGVSLQIFDQSGVSVAESYQFSQENGRFDIRSLPAGNYVIRAFSAQPPNQQVQAEARFALSAELNNLHLALVPVPPIPVNVQMNAQPQPVQSAPAGPRRMVDFGPPHAVREPPVSIRLLGATPNLGESFASLENPQEPSSFSLRNVAPGRYGVILEPREGWYVVSAEYGSTNLLTDDLVIAPGAPPLSVNVLLRNDSASLTGRVNVPNKFQGHANIVAVPESLPKASPAVTVWFPSRDNNESTFVFDSLAPGDYLLFAFDHIDGLEYGNRDALQNYASRALRVTLSPGQRSKVTLDLITTEEAQ